MTSSTHAETGLEIAVIGMSGKFPGANNLSQFWQNLKNGIETITFFTPHELLSSGSTQEDIDRPNYVPAAGVLRDKGYFDSAFFGYSPKEAESMEPMARIFHEVAWEALEDAGYDPLNYSGAIGLYAGASTCFDWQMLLTISRMSGAQTDQPLTHMTENSLLVSTRIAHKLNLMGPTVTLFTACSTSLVAIHTACRSLLTGDCHMALAGAGSVSAAQVSGYFYQEGMIMSPDGHCRSFDENAGGTLYGDGVGVVVLKRLKHALAEGDNIHAVIKATAVNNDGSGKASYTAPGKKRITDVLRAALKLSHWQPQELDFIEAHGTATPLGDTIEMEALQEAFHVEQKNFCAIGSLKSNFGHLDVAAGIAGFIKVVLALKHGLIPPSLHYQKPNPVIDFITSPFYVNAHLTPLVGPGPFRAGVCSFGIGGTNGFILVESVAPRALFPVTQNPHLILLSARTDQALAQMIKNLGAFLQENPHLNLMDVAYTLQVGRHAFSRRCFLLCAHGTEAIQKLTAQDGNGLFMAMATGKEKAENVTEILKTMGLPANEETLKHLGEVWLKGGVLPWSEYYERLPLAERPHRITLPNYPFERHYYWLKTGPLPVTLASTAVQPVVPQVAEPGFYPRPTLSVAFQAPKTDQELALAKVWQLFFRITEIGVHDDFFELGGDSLSAITMITDLQRQLNIRVPISQLFLTPTIAGLVHYLAEHHENEAEREEISNPGFNPIEPVEEREYYPLSSVQKRIYVLHQMSAGNTGYNTPLLLELSGELEREKLVLAFQSLIRRHESLRTSFVMLNGEPVQRIHHDLPFDVAFFDWTKREKWLSQELEEQIIAPFIQSFDLSTPPLLRVGLTALPEQKQLLIIDMHHIITDGSSIGILLREFIMYYLGQEPAPLRIQYKDYAAWQNTPPQIKAMKKQEAFWLNQLADEIPVLHLPTDFVRPAIQSFAGHTTVFTLNTTETTALKELAKQNNATLFMVLLASYTILLAKWSQQEDIIVGSPIAGRTHGDLQPLIGMLVNTLALRNAPQGCKTFLDYLGEVKRNTLAAFENQDYLFEDLVEQVTTKIGRDASRNPIFDTVFNLLNFASPEQRETNLEGPGITLKTREYDRGVAIFDLSFQGNETPDGMFFKVEYNSDLFKGETITRLIGYFKKIMADITSTPHSTIGAISMLSEEEKAHLLFTFNTVDFHYTTDKTIVLLFLDQVIKNPDCLALSGVTHGLGTDACAETDPIHITYKELNERANRLANSLNAMGILPQAMLGILAERSIEMIIAILAAWKTGCAYVPLNPKAPVSRSLWMLNECGVHWLLGTKTQAHSHELMKQWQGEQLIIDATGEAGEPEIKMAASFLAYVIFTSGSTGLPKGVLITHDNVTPILLWGQKHLDIQPCDRALQNLSFYFDWSVYEIFLLLTNGGSLFLAADEVLLEPQAALAYLQKNDITVLHITPTQYGHLIGQTGVNPTLKHLYLGAEKLTKEMLTRSLNSVSAQCRVYNLYGPTETAIMSSAFEIIRGLEPAFANLSSVPIGYSIANGVLLVLDPYYQLCPVHVSGELWIGGAGLAPGYLNNPELTAEKFCDIPNLYSSLKRYYKTGDLARWLADGSIEFLGRSDEQVKIRGFRIEPGEIESKLRLMAAIQEAVVLALTTEQGEHVLCAYVVPKGELEVQEVVAFLAQELPNYMIPSYFVPLSRIPLNANGKLDKKALPSPFQTAALTCQHNLKETRKGARNEVENKLLTLWADLLKIEKKHISIERSFFQLGGHSLKATLLAARMHREMGVKIPLAEIFKTPTIIGLADYVQQHKKETFRAITPVEEREYYPLSTAQTRLFFLQQLDPAGTGYNMPQLFPITATLTTTTLENTFYTLIKRHESLRTSFFMVEGEAVQCIHQDVPFQVTSAEGLTASLVQPFDLTQAPLLRVVLVYLEKQANLFIDMHHIISDGFSQHLLIQDFMRLLNNESLVPLALQYRDFVAWQNTQKESPHLKAQEQYWCQQFADEIQPLFLPYDFPRPAVQDFTGQRLSLVLSADETEALKQLAENTGATLFMVLLAIYTVVLGKLSNQEEIILGTPVSGRRHADLEGIVGVFINMVALRHYPTGTKSFTSYLAEVQEQFLAALENQDYPFDALVEQLALPRVTDRSPLFDVMFSLTNQASTTLHATAGVTGTAAAPADHNEQNPLPVAAKYDLTLHVEEQNDVLICYWEYAVRLFSESTIKRFKRYFLQVLHGVLAEPGVALAQVDILNSEEKHQLLVAWNNTFSPYPREKSLGHCFADEVAQHPERIALEVPGSMALTYAYIDHQALALAGWLQEHGACAEALIALQCERSLDMIITLLAILKVGSAYVPISPTYPVERRDYILRDSNAALLLTDNPAHKSESSRWQGRVYDFAELPGLGGKKAPHHHSLLPTVQPSSLAYVLYTSGSTGKPKGVLVEHRNVVRLVKETHFFTWSGGEKLLLTGALVFDISTWEIWGPLLNGLSLVLVEQNSILDAESLASIIMKADITILHLIPQLFNQIVQLRPEMFAGLKWFLIGGDWVRPNYVNLIRQQCHENGLTILHMYGPTENTTFSTFLQVKKDYQQSIPIGKPIDQSTAYVFDQYMNVQPVGVVGELAVGGDGVARGYLNNPELTATKFKWYEPSGLPIYLTGDLARWCGDGNLEFLGRADQQVKIRGMRIELGEIENLLLRYPQVQEALVVVNTHENGEPYLCAYIVAPGAIASSQLAQYLAVYLPAYMIPSYFIALPAVPVTPNGKVNRKALPKPQLPTESALIKPGNELEKGLQAIWAQVLAVKEEQLGIRHNFFQLGGHSLKVTSLAALIQKQWHVTIPLVEIFKNPTIEAMAVYISQQKRILPVALTPAEEQEYYPLSSAQKRLYFLQQLIPQGTIYNMPQQFGISTALTLSELHAIFKELLARHESLRTAYIVVHGEVVQKVFPVVTLPITVVEQPPLDWVKPFDLSKPPLLRVLVFRRADVQVLFIDMHHIISDGFSQQIIEADFVALAEKRSLSPLALQYKDFAVWQNREMQSPRLLSQQQYWLNQFLDDIPQINLPIDFPRPGWQSFSGFGIKFQFSAAETSALNQLAKSQGATLFIVLLSVYTLLLSKLSYQEDIIVGTPVAGRRYADLESIVGVFINTLPLRNFPVGQHTFLTFLAAVKERFLGALENQDFPFDTLVEQLAITRATDRSPVFDVMFALDEFATQSNLVTAQEEGTEIPLAAKFDLTLNMALRQDYLDATLEYATALFHQDSIKRFIVYFKNLVKSISQQPNLTIAELDMLPDAEKAELLFTFNRLDFLYSTEKTVVQLFSEQVIKRPDALALCGLSQGVAAGGCAGTDPIHLTYKELNERVNRLANTLIAMGIVPQVMLGILAERSIEMIIAILAAWKSGCAYVPLNPKAPVSRSMLMLKECGVHLLLCTTTQATHHELVKQWQGDLLFIDAAGDAGEPKIKIASSFLAYVIFTSGSTGQPKGVLITHGNLSPILFWGYEYLGIQPRDRALQNLSFYFDWSVYEMFLLLTSGGSLFLAADEVLLEPQAALAYLQKHDITVLHITPTQYGHWIGSCSSRVIKTLTYLFLGAEKLTKEMLVRSMSSVSPQCRVFNMYGPTEATIISSAFEMIRGHEPALANLASVPIGVPIGNTVLLVLDPYYQLCPVHITGQLWIGGDGLALGYLNNPELTAGKFCDIPNPYNSLKRFYKTGDLVRWLGDGNLEFLGRVDQQVKIRGMRIELGEIENVILRYPQVREALVLANPVEGGEMALCAYIVSQSEWEVSALRQFIAQFLPQYMIPVYFMALEKIPFTSNGKVNRQALPVPQRTEGEVFVAPLNEVEKRLVVIWAQVLRINPGVVSSQVDFFQCGGHSLKAMELLAQVQHELLVQVPLLDFFKAPTIRALAEYIEEKQKQTQDNPVIISRLSHDTLVPLKVDGRFSVHVFLFHDGTGEVAGYIDFCRYFRGEYSCWGLRAGEWLQGAPLDITIGQIAAYYIEQMVSVQSVGPYYLVGWSLGGVVAFEVARQLEEQGQQVAFIGLLDTPAPVHGGVHPFAHFALAAERQWLDESLPEVNWAEIVPQVSGTVALWVSVSQHLESSGYPVEKLKEKIPVFWQSIIPHFAEIGLRELLMEVNLVRALSAAQVVYEPVGKVQGQVVFFQPGESPRVDREVWQSYCEQSIQWQEIEGDHFSIFKEPLVQQTVESVSQWLDSMEGKN